MATPKFTVLGSTWTTTEAAAAEVAGNSTELAEALALTVVTAGGHEELGGHNFDGPEFEYSATATDNGIAGILSGEPGLVFAGPTGLYTPAKVIVTDVAVFEGTIAPEETDELTLGLFVNSALWAIADEGYITPENENEEADELFNLTATVSLTELDVVRLALLTINGDEAAQDWDVSTSGILEIT